MIPSALLSVLSVGLLASKATAISPPQFVTAVWSTSAFDTISGPDGNSNEVNHDGGFSLVDRNGNTIFSEKYPNGYVPCQGNGYRFTLSDGCLAQSFEFECHSKFDGSPKNCEVFDQGGNSLGKADGNTDTHFIGIAVTQDGTCGVSFALGRNTHCEPDSKGFTVS